ncbi:MAG: hypothetical protein NC102_06380 [Clostridium sp.]|nr:hypothetical protein [Clostridium sp.]
MNRRILFILAGLAIGIACWAKMDWDAQAAKRKAELAFLEGQNQYGQQNYDNYALLALRAHGLDSADLDIAGEWGQVTLLLRPQDSLACENAYSAIVNLFDANKDNYLTGITLARIARNSSRFSDEAHVWATLDSVFPSYAQPLQELGQAYLLSYAMGDSTGYGKALNAFDRLEAANGKSVALSAQKVRAYMFKSDTAATVNEIESLAKSAPNDCYTAFYVGTIYNYLHRNDKALEYLDRAAELDSTIGAIYLTRADVYMEQGDSAAYDREMNMALLSPNLEVEQKMDIMRKYVTGMIDDPAQYGQLRSLFERLELLHPGEAQVHDLYSSFLYTIKDYSGAAEQAGYSVALDGDVEDSWTMMVQSSMMADEMANAMEGAKEAMERFPQNLYFPMAVAQALNADGKIKEAIAVVDSVKIDQVNNPKGVSRFLSFRGDMYTIDADTASALKLYDQAVELDPDNYMAMNNAAYFMSLQGIDLDKAEKYASAAVRGEPENPTYMDTYAWVFFRKKDYSMAKNYIDITLNLYGLGEAKGEEEDAPNPTDDEELEEEVISEVEEDVNLIPSSDVFEHAGDIYFMSGEPAKALDFWKKALELEPDREILQRKVKHKTYFYE